MRAYKASSSSNQNFLHLIIERRGAGIYSETLENDTFSGERENTKALMP